MSSSSTFTFGPHTVHRLGYGAMRITGAGVWGEPKDPIEAIAVLRRAVELGVDFIDTADSYGPEVSERLIREAVHPYGGVRVATKAGLVRTGPDQWHPCGRPHYLRQQCEMSLRRLGVEQIDLFQLHRIDPEVTAEDQFGLLKDLLNEGKVATVGLSEVSVDEIRAASEIVPISTVQNLYNVTNRQSEAVVTYCEEQSIGFIPWFPVAAGKLAVPGGPLDEISTKLGLSVAQLSLAWLLRRSPVMLPIPGTSKVAHLEENMVSAGVELDESTVTTLNSLAS